jgi:hypothetical protein
MEMETTHANFTVTRIQNGVYQWFFCTALFLVDTKRHGSSYKGRRAA